MKIARERGCVRAKRTWDYLTKLRSTGACCVLFSSNQRMKDLDLDLIFFFIKSNEVTDNSGLIWILTKNRLYWSIF